VQMAVLKEYSGFMASSYRVGEQTARHSAKLRRKRGLSLITAVEILQAQYETSHHS
jgi:hypothetical protein